jgi:hypothetical protein
MRFWRLTRDVEADLEGKSEFSWRGRGIPCAAPLLKNTLEKKNLE